MCIQNEEYAQDFDFTNHEHATHDRYEAHAFCKHPNRRRAPGDDWTRHIELEICGEAQLAARHARGRDSDVLCNPPVWEAVINPLLYVYCDSCENTFGKNGGRAMSATNMWADFEVKRDQWQYIGVLDDAELQSIKRDIDRARRQHEDETNRGPFNNSYWVLREALEVYTAYWDEFVKDRVEKQRKETEAREAQKAWDLTRFGNRVDEAMEISMYAPGFLAEAEASHYHEPFKRPRKQGGWEQMIVGKGKGKGKEQKRERR